MLLFTQKPFLCFRLCSFIFNMFVSFQPRQLVASFSKIQGERKPFFCKPAIELLDKLLTLDPERRISAADALDSDYFWTDPMPTPKVETDPCSQVLFFSFASAGEASRDEILLRVDEEEFESKSWRRSARTEEAQTMIVKLNEKPFILPFLPEVAPSTEPPLDPHRNCLVHRRFCAASSFVF